MSNQEFSTDLRKLRKVISDTPVILEGNRWMSGQAASEVGSFAWRIVAYIVRLRGSSVGFELVFA